MIENNLVPHRTEIQEEMSKKFGIVRYAPALQSIIYTCAEVAEQLALRVNTHVVQHHSHITMDSNYSKRTGIACPSCRAKRIVRDHNFCPRCGIKIKWI